MNVLENSPRQDESIDSNKELNFIWPGDLNGLNEKVTEVFELADFIEKRSELIRSQKLSENEYGFFCRAKSNVWNLKRKVETAGDEQWESYLNLMITNIDQILMENLRYHTMNEFSMKHGYFKEDKETSSANFRRKRALFLPVDYTETISQDSNITGPNGQKIKELAVCTRNNLRQMDQIAALEKGQLNSDLVFALRELFFNVNSAARLPYLRQIHPAEFDRILKLGYEEQVDKMENYFSDYLESNVEIMELFSWVMSFAESTVYKELENREKDNKFYFYNYGRNLVQMYINAFFGGANNPSKMAKYFNEMDKSCSNSVWKMIGQITLDVATYLEEKERKGK